MASEKSYPFQNLINDYLVLTIPFIETAKFIVLWPPSVSILNPYGILQKHPETQN